MKLKHLLLGLGAIAALFSCKQEEPYVEPTLEVSPAAVSFGSAADEQVIYITSNNDWTAESNAAWLELGAASGKAATDKVELTLYVAENTAEEARVAKVTVTSAGLVKEISVTQAAVDPKPEEPAQVTVSVEALEATAAAGEYTFQLTANKAWTVTEEVDWVTVEPAAGEPAEAVTVKVTVAENPVEEVRTATIKVAAQDAEKAIVLTQAAAEPKETGSQEKPWLIKTTDDLAAMRSKALPGTETWFRLENDLDMSAVTNWIPVNYGDVEGEGEAAVTTFTRKVHFDGNNKTIRNFAPATWLDGETACSYPSLFGVLYGSCKDLKFDNVTISGSSACGVIAGYVGTYQNETEMPGTVENVTITNASVSSSAGNVGGVCGATKKGTFKNVSYKGTVTCTAGKSGSSTPTGGLTAQAYLGSSFEDCSVDVVINSKGDDIGGLIGKIVDGTTTVKKCSSKAVMTVGGRRCGGLIGWNASAGTTTITDCHVLEGSSVTLNVTEGGASLGGFIGFGDTAGAILTISNCSAKVNVDAGTTAGQSGVFMGALGYASTVKIENSSAVGNITANQYFCAGILGLASNADVTITGCSYSGNVTSSGYVGGIVGDVKGGSSKLTISGTSATGTYSAGGRLGGILGCVETTATITNCIADVTLQHDSGNYVGGAVGGISANTTCIISKTYVKGAVAKSNQYVGGLVGAAQGANQSIENCASTMNITAGGKQVGGLVGTATSKITITNSFASGTVNAGSVPGGIVGRIGAAESTVSKCVAWNATVAATTKSSAGAIIGSLEKSGNYSSCIRRSDMTLKGSSLGLSDQNDITTVSTTVPYHGKAAAADATISSVAKSLGWDETVWDLSKDVPTLK